MRIIVSARGSDLEAETSPLFGRCSQFILIDPESMAFDVLNNPAAAAAGGAGVQAARFAVDHGAGAVVTGSVGPNAFKVLQSAGIPIYLFDGGTVGEAVEGFREGRLVVARDAAAPEHAGIGGDQPRKMDGAKVPQGSRQEEIDSLRVTSADLRTRLADVMARLERLEGDA